jgi:protein TonB
MRRHPKLHWCLLRCLFMPAVLALALAGCGKEPTPQRKQQIVRLLPDTPPPPPPPPKPEDKPPPQKPDDKPAPQDVPKPVDAPQPQALKSDEAAGDGPGNGLSAGAVSQDYSDQKIGQGTSAGAGAADSAVQRMAANAYANALTRALNEHLARDRDVKRLDYRVQVDLWLTQSGGLQRVELRGSTGDAATDDALRAAMGRYAGPGTPLPQRMPQPVRLQVSNRLLG